jgi:hypothetical protein
MAEEDNATAQQDNVTEEHNNRTIIVEQQQQRDGGTHMGWHREKRGEPSPLSATAKKEGTIVGKAAERKGHRFPY